MPDQLTASGGHLDDGGSETLYMQCSQNRTWDSRPIAMSDPCKHLASTLDVLSMPTALHRPLVKHSSVEAQQEVNEVAEPVFVQGTRFDDSFTLTPLG